MQYLAHEAFVAPARRKPQIWRLLLGMVMIAACYALGLLTVVFAVLLVSGGDYLADFLMNIELGLPVGPTGTLLILATFMGMAIGPMVAVAAFHERSMGSLFGALPQTVRHFLIAMCVCAAAYSVSFLIPNDAELAPNIEWSIWLSFLPMALLGVLIQTGSEEILFRGYIQQQLAARFRATWVWLILPAFAFGFLHWQPEVMGDNAIFIVAAATLFGLLASDLTAKTGSIGAAWGFHFANNVVAILLVSLEGPLSGLALSTATIAPDSADIRPLILLDMGTTLATWVLIRLAVTRFP